MIMQTDDETSTRASERMTTVGIAELKANQNK